MRKAIISTNLAKPAFKYSHLVKAGPNYYFSGMLAQDRQSGALVGDTVGAQAEKILENVQVLMQEFGLGFENLAIARIFLKNPPILILDEATSALDTETERAIQASLAELAEGRTTLVIAHRLSTVRQADLIVVLRDGEIIEQGAFDELLRRGGAFAALYHAQLAPVEGTGAGVR